MEENSKQSKEEAESNQVSFYNSDALSELLNCICDAFNCGGQLSRLEFWDIVGKWSVDHNGSAAAGAYYAFHGFRKDNKGMSMNSCHENQKKEEVDSPEIIEKPAPASSMSVSRSSSDDFIISTPFMKARRG